MTQVTKTFVGTTGTDVVANDSSLSYITTTISNFPALKIDTNKVAPSNDNGGTQAVYLNGVSFGARQYCAITASSGAGLTTTQAFTAILRSDGSADVNAVRWYISNGYQSIYSVLAGVETNLSAMDSFLAVADNDVFSIEIDATGTTFTLQKNGTPIGSSPYTNAVALPAGPRIGAGFNGADTTESFRLLQFVADDFGASAAVLSSPGETSITANGVTSQVTSSAAGGTLYMAITPTSAPPSNAQIKALSGGGIVAGSSIAATLGVNSLTASGLSSSTGYYSWFLQDNGLDSNVVSDPFTTASAAPVSYPIRSDMYF